MYEYKIVRIEFAELDHAFAEVLDKCINGMAAEGWRYKEIARVFPASERGKIKAVVVFEREKK